MFEREDWTLFRNLGTLGQKAGVPVRKLASLVVKELTDNALDAGANVKLHRQEGIILIEDDGPGLPGTGEEIARMFSIRRPLTSSKLIRLPFRGALGNGLRVVTGAVLASGGTIYVETRGQRHFLRPHDDGHTEVRSESCGRKTGTLVAIQFGNSIPISDDVLSLSHKAITFAKHGKIYEGKTSPWWYDSESFFEMCRAAGGRPLEHLLEVFRSISKNKAVELGCGRQANSLSRFEADELLQALRVVSTEPSPSILGKIGDFSGNYAYAHESGRIEVRGSGIEARLPFSIDAYVKIEDDDGKDGISVMVNRTPIVGEISVQRQKAHQIGIIGCGLKHVVDAGRKPVSIFINVTTPYMPVTTDGKEPDLYRYIAPLFHAIEKAARKAKRQAASSGIKASSQREVIESCLSDAISKASGQGKYRYSLRQLFYAVRPYLLELFGKESEYNYFAQVITDIEASRGGDLPGLYRDARGVIYHPHLQQEIPLGTLNVEQYQRPEWTFNCILYSEKEGFFSILKDAGWPEYNDCALMTSKGFASRAARDVLDLIGDTGEEIYFFCIHDADASGTLIYQSLTEATRARGARKVHVINLGLDPQEAIEMGLQVETFRSDDDKKSKRQLPVASYVEDKWKNWLQTRRVELNAMTSPEFLDWLDRKFAPYVSKVVPPQRVLQDKFADQARQAIQDKLTTKILAEANLEDQVEQLMSGIHNMDNSALETAIRGDLELSRREHWSEPLERRADEAAELLTRKHRKP